MNSRHIAVGISLLVILAMLGAVITPATAQPGAAGARVRGAEERLPKLLQEVPEEARALFENGLTVDQFLALNKGPVPQALANLTDASAAFIVEMDRPPLAQLYAEQLAQNQSMAASEQRTYVESLSKAQEPVAASMAALGGTVIDRFTKAYNGLLVRLPLKSLPEVQKLPGVKAVHRAPVHKPALTTSVPLIKADLVTSNLLADGSGVTIAVIDTGIDYTHAAFGGSGDPADYDANDPDMIEPGSFPTTKVIGGYDFAGPDYNADGTTIAETVPAPDNDPLDGDGHGTHVSSIAAGEVVTGIIGHGVAPRASLYALKVFGEPAGTTNLVVSAIEWTMDPDGDGNISDHVDVINMSLGSDFGPNSIADPEIVSSNFASRIGIVVVAAAGNAGNTSYITGSPAAASAAVSVAASTTGYATGPTISIQSTSIVTNTNVIYQSPAFDMDSGHFTQTITATLSYVGDLAGASDDELCSTDGLAANALLEDIALIQRGSCAFTDKVNNAASLGAVGAIVFNHATGGNSRTTMAGPEVSIPAGFVAHDHGVSLALDSGMKAVVTSEDDVTTISDLFTPADTIADFSSRGPRGFDSFLKPDVTAPGVGILAAKMGGGTEGTSLSGTSMASPHIAGVAALMRELYPAWSSEQVKAALMNTAIDLADEDSAQVPRQGAGRVDALAAASTTSLAFGDPHLVSLNWGVVPLGVEDYADRKFITLENLLTSSKVYSATWEFGPGSFMVGFDMTLPISVSVDASPGFAYVPVDISVDSTMVPAAFLTLEEYYGYIQFTNTTDISDTLRVPFYAVPQPYSQLAVTDSSQMGFSGLLELANSGPRSSSLWAYPLYDQDGNEPGIGDAGDLRMFGMDYGGTHPTYGPLVIPAFNVFGSWHTPQRQPGFAKFELYLDVDQDSYNTPDFLDFNYNLRYLTGLPDDYDVWVVIQVNLLTDVVDLGSPFTIYTDYNSGYMEWYLAALWHDLDPAADTDFNYQLYSFDYNGNSEMGNPGYFDYSRPPFGWNLSNDPGPGESANLSFWLESPGGFHDSHPLGLMVVDYNGKSGQGQAHAFLFANDMPFNGFLPAVRK